MTKSLLELDETIEAVKGMHVLGEGNFFFDNVQTDSRAVKLNSLFVPLIGENQDGHAYVPQAIEKGASVVFICTASFEKDGSFFGELSIRYPGVFFIAVENTLRALQDAAACYVQKFPDLIKIAVTGSSGKTTTKEIAASILRQKYSVITNRGNLNSETGLPLSVFEIRAEHKAGIFEMGMNRENEIGEIAAVLKPRYAVVTNIGTAHIGKLGSRDAIAREKAKVFDHFNGIGTGFIPCDDDYTEFLKDQIDGNCIMYGAGQDEKVYLEKDMGLEGSLIAIGNEKALLPLPGKYNCKNAMGAIALAKFLGLSDKEIAQGIESLEVMFGRSQVVKGKYSIIQDCYNANPDSMEKALDFVSQIETSSSRILVLGDMLELGEESRAEHEKAGTLAAESGAGCAVFAGAEMEAAWKQALKIKPDFNCIWVQKTDDEGVKEIASFVMKNAGEGDIILVKGSRGMALERVVQKIQEG